VIDLAFELPLARFTLRVAARLGDGITAIMGPSGAGKTSLLEAIAGIRHGVTGRIAVGDTYLQDDAARIRLPPERRRVGYVPQDAGLFPHLSTLENIRFGARGAEDRVRSAVESLELGALLAHRPVMLSGGERQRVALARALASDARLLLLDEPLAALDVGLRGRIVPYLRRIREEWKVPALYVTHNVGEALALAEAVLLLRDGRVEAQGPALDLLALPGLSEASAAGIENLLRGRVGSHDPQGGTTRVLLEDGTTLSIPLAAHAPGATMTLGIRAEDIVVAVTVPHGLSARNVLEARVAAVDRLGHDALLRCDPAGASGQPWLVRITASAAGALGLAPGKTVWLAIKSHSIRMV
jgi:molybdate transport system ATP-binding protein